MHRRSYGLSDKRARVIGEVIHTDVCGFMEINSLGKSRYFLLFKDDMTHYRHVYFLGSKSEVYDCFKNYLQRVENEISRSINILRSDNGLEFVNERMQKLMFDKDIKHVTTTPYTPEQNGRAEKENHR